MNYLAIIKQKKTSIAIITGVFVIFSLLISLLHPLEYSASNRLMIIQPTNITLDAYSATKSVERVGDKLSQVVYTTSFFDKVMAASEFNIDASYFKKDERKKRKQWQEMVETSVSRGSGLMNVKVYHTNKSQAAQLISAITHVFSKNGWEYIGSMNIQISEVDSALISKWPERPRFFLNAFLGLLLGLIVSISYALISKKGYKTKDLLSKIKDFAKTFDGSVDDLGKSEMKETSYVSEITNEISVKPNENITLADSQSTYNIDEEIPKLREIEIDRF